MMNDERQDSKNLFDNSEVENRLRAIDKLTLAGTTKALLKCRACSSVMSSIIDTAVRDNTGTWAGKGCDEIVRLCITLEDKLADLMHTEMDEILYNTDFASI